MNSQAQTWLEDEEGAVSPLPGDCMIGRGPENHLLVADPGVSRRHALIHAQGAGEHWLLDLGSCNGTYLNGRRLTRPCAMRDGDHIVIGTRQWIFRQSADPAAGSRQGPASSRTVPRVRAVECWLLMADMIGSTRMIRDEDGEEVARILGAWLAECRDRIEASGGTINKFLGDGLFAYWSAGLAGAAGIARLLDELRAMQERQSPPFRVALHRGKATMGGGVSLGEEELVGADVNRLFRLERLASALKVQRLASEEAAAGLAGQEIGFTDQGKHVLEGFLQESQVYGW